MSKTESKCEIWSWNQDRMIERLEGHEWVTSYTGKSRQCRICNKFERLEESTTATKGETV